MAPKVKGYKLKKPKTKGIQLGKVKIKKRKNKK